MSRIVFCQRLKKELKGLDSSPFPGELGQKIYQSVSEQAYKEWLIQQVMVINEYQLSLFETKSQEFLNKMMEDYLFEGKDVHLSGKNE